MATREDVGDGVIVVGQPNMGPAAHQIIKLVADRGHAGQLADVLSRFASRVSRTVELLVMVETRLDTGARHLIEQDGVAFIQGDANLEFNRIVDVLVALRDAGVRKVGFLTGPKVPPRKKE